MGLHGAGDVVEHAAMPPAAGFNDAQQRLHEPAPGGALSAEAQLPPDHRLTQGPLGFGGCPGCPPRFFRDVGFGFTGLACGCCVLGGSEEFSDVFFSLASSAFSAATSARSSTTRAGSSRTMACASDDSRAIRSFVISSDMHRMSQIPRFQGDHFPTRERLRRSGRKCP